MNKIAIVTLYENNYNYGAVLQAFALQKKVEELSGCEAVIIRYKDNRPRFFLNRTPVIEKLTYRDRMNFSYLKYKFFQKLVMPRKRTTIRKNMEERKEAFQTFSKKYMKISRLYTNDDISKTQDEYEIFICGSDQIWKPECTSDFYFLDFVKNRKRKIAYAPSIGYNSLKIEEKNVYRTFLDSFSKISVREKTGVSILQEITNKEVFLALDPTLLYSGDEWIKMNQLKEKEEEFFFAYFLGKDFGSRKIVKRLAKEENFPLYYIPFGACEHANDLYFSKYSKPVCGPGEFLEYILGAQCVFTDSFHGMVFSVLFHKQFIVFSREGENADSTDGRITSLLHEIGLEERFCNSIDSAYLLRQQKIDYEKVDAILRKKRAESLAFLLDAVKV